MLVLTALLAGCQPHIDLARPDAPRQNQYLPAGETASIDGMHVSLGADAPDAWWRVLASDKINELVSLALTNNQSLASAQAHLSAARDRLRAARGALSPQVDASAAAQRTRFGAPTLGPLAKDFPLFSAYSAGPEVSYDVDLFGATRWRIERAAGSAQLESAQLRAVALSISGNVVIQVLQTASLRSQIRVAEQIVADDDRMLSLMRGAREAGAVSTMDVLSARSQADHDRTLLPPLHQLLSAAQDALASLVGVAASDWTAPEIDLDELRLPHDLPLALPSDLVHRRPDILAAEAQLREAGAAVGIATTNMYPRLTLSATVGEDGLIGGGPSETAWNLLGGITAPIFHGGSLSAERRAAQDDYRASLAAYRQTVLDAFNQVAATLQALGDDADSLTAQQQALDSASESFELTRQAYTAGNAGYVRVLDAQRLHQQAKLGQVQAYSQRYLDAVKLQLAAGGRTDGRPN